MYNEDIELITIEELCCILYIGKNRAYELLKANQIKAFRIGRVWKIPKCSVDKYIMDSCNNNQNK